MKDIAWMGIDPGQTGAAVIIGESWQECSDWPGDPVQFAAHLRQWRDDYDIRMTVVEQVGTRPGQGVSSSGKFMRQAGMIEGVLAALQIPYQRLTPQKWRKGLIVGADGDDTKTAALTVARRMFPAVDWLTRKKDHNRADALLMAYVARKMNF